MMISLSILTIISFTGCMTKKSDLPVSLTIWHYYNGMQQQAFSDLISEFNETAGLREGIFIEAYCKGSISDLRNSVIEASEHRVGADEMPDIFLAYADSAYDLYKKNLITDLSPYISKKERSKYIESYLQEGDLSHNGSLMLFPVAKSTEVLMVNMTDYAPFASACNIGEQDLTTWESITDIAEKYYNYTDSLTKTPNDGKAFFGRDSIANYIFIGSSQLGENLFSVESNQLSLNINHDAMRRIWDNYYVPYVSGHFAALGRFRSDDAKTGDIIALVGSSSGASYFPNSVTRADGSSYKIEAKVFPLPNFEGCDKFAVQQGAGMAVTKSDERTERAAVTFLKWFTESKQNLRFCANTGYLPVKENTNDIALLHAAIKSDDIQISPIVEDTLEVGMEMSKTYHFYTNEAFDNAYEFREIVEDSMTNFANTDLDIINALVRSGEDRQKALKPFLDDDHFELWLDAFENDLSREGI